MEHTENLYFNPQNVSLLSFCAFVHHEVGRPRLSSCIIARRRSLNPGEGTGANNSVDPHLREGPFKSWG